MVKMLDAGRRTLALFGALALLLAINGSFFSQKAACVTCWNREDASCIIDGMQVDNACDAETPGCFPLGT